MSIFRVTTRRVVSVATLVIGCNVITNSGSMCPSIIFSLSFKVAFWKKFLDQHEIALACSGDFPGSIGTGFLRIRSTSFLVVFLVRRTGRTPPPSAPISDPSENGLLSLQKCGPRRCSADPHLRFQEGCLPVLLSKEVYSYERRTGRLTPPPQP